MLKNRTAVSLSRSISVRSLISRSWKKNRVSYRLDSVSFPRKRDPPPLDRSIERDVSWREKKKKENLKKIRVNRISFFFFRDASMTEIFLHVTWSAMNFFQKRWAKNFEIDVVINKINQSAIITIFSVHLHLFLRKKFVSSATRLIEWNLNLILISF